MVSEQQQLEQIINQLSNAHQISNDLVLTKSLINKLQIEPNYPIILIGGTNGKGSTCAYLTTILTLAGYKVGTFTSPHVFKYNERIAINNQPIANYNLITHLNQVIGTLNQIAGSSEPKSSNLGLFKALTLAAHLYFIHQKIDIAIIEVGIGGKQDVTNLFEPTISAITGIDYDHCHILGDTLESIGLEKAHIYRGNKPAFFGSPNLPNSVIDYAHQIKANFEFFDLHFGVICHEFGFDVWCLEQKFYSLPYPALRGKEQVNNVALALAILSKLKNSFPISIGAIKASMLQIKLIGRFQVMPGIPQIIFDVAHNPQAIQNMLQNMVKLPFASQNIAVFGIASDKDVAKIIEIAHKSFDIWHIAPIASSRSFIPDQIKAMLIEYSNTPKQITIHESITAAMQKALDTVNEQQRIVCFGSFLTVDEAYRTYDIHMKK